MTWVIWKVEIWSNECRAKGGQGRGLIVRPGVCFARARGKATTERPGQAVKDWSPASALCSLLWQCVLMRILSGFTFQSSKKANRKFCSPCKRQQCLGNGSVYKLNKGEMLEGRDASRCIIAFQGRPRKTMEEIPSLNTSKSSEMLKETTTHLTICFFAVSFCVFVSSTKVTLDTEQGFISLWHFLFSLHFHSDIDFGEWEVSGQNNSASLCIFETNTRFSFECLCWICGMEMGWKKAASSCCSCHRPEPCRNLCLSLRTWFPIQFFTYLDCK